MSVSYFNMQSNVYDKQYKKEKAENKCSSLNTQL